MAEMTSRERVFATLERREPDRVPMLEWSVSPVVREAVLPGRSYFDFLDEIGLDAVMMGFGYAFLQGVEWLDKEKKVFRDNWGVKRAFTEEDIAYPLEGPIETPEDLTRYTPPDAHAEGVLGDFPELVKRFKKDKAIVWLGRDSFINPSYLRGLDRLLMDFIENPSLAHELADMSVAYSKAVFKRAIDAGAEIIMLGDDYASKKGPHMSPAHFREFVFPGLKELVAYIHECGAYVVKHTDGYLWPILDQIVESGVDAVNPIDPSAGMDIGEVKAEFGDRVCVVGNIDCGQTLCTKSVEEVVREVKECIKKASPGGGHILSSSNSIQSGTKPENFLAMIEAGKQYGVYPIKVD